MSDSMNTSGNVYGVKFCSLCGSKALRADRPHDPEATLGIAFFLDAMGRRRACCAECARALAGAWASKVARVEDEAVNDRP